MPELPDVTLYVEALASRVKGVVLEGVRVVSPFLVRTAVPPLDSAAGRKVTGVRRIGKRIVFELEGELHLVLHLMIAGRLHWKEHGAAVPRRGGLAGFDFASGTLLFTETSTHKRASLHVLEGALALAAVDRGGIDPLTASLAELTAALGRENRTLKRALTDPRLVSGIGNAYSDEILHAARLSPVALTHALEAPEIERLHGSLASTLVAWTERLRSENGGRFPERVTAFHEGMSVHGRFGKPCPVCGTTVQRIRYATNEVNYCPRCQTAGKVLADRSLSRLLRGDWPRSIEELEERAERNAPKVPVRRG